MGDTEQQTQLPVEEQVTSKAPATKQKNPKRVAAGKAIAERMRIAREAQKKALIEAQSIIASAKPPVDATPVDTTPVDRTPVDATPETTKNVLTTTQWLSIVSIVVSLVGLYYKREEIKKTFTKKADPPLPQALPREPLSAASKKIRQMD